MDQKSTYSDFQGSRYRFDPQTKKDLALRILFLAFKGRILASSRIRAWQMADHWVNAECVNATEFFTFTAAPFASIPAYDCFVYQKLQVSKDTIDFAKAVRKAGKHLVWDICDPLWWWMPASDFLALAKYVSAFVVVSRGLQEDLKRDMKIDSVVIPDRLPYREGCKVHSDIEKPVLVWSGFSRTLL